MERLAETGERTARGTVFISYSRKDQTFADELATQLTADGFRVLIDRADIAPAEDWRARLDALILEADAIAFVISPDSVGSEICAWEVDRTKALGKRLAPLLLRPLPDDAIPAELARLNWINFEPASPREAAFAKLRQALETDIGWIREHTRVVQLSSRWDQSGRPDSQVLRGGEITAVQGWMSRRAEGAPSLTDELIVFVDASVAFDQTQREKERAQIVRVRRGQRAVAIALGVLFLVLAGGAWSAVDLDWRAREQVSRLLSSAAHQASDSGEDARAVRLALLAAREALATPRGAALDEAEPALARAARETRLIAEVHASPIISAAFSPDGGAFITSSADGTAQLWDARTGAARSAPMRHNEGNVYAASFSADGRVLATAGDDHTARLWDAHTGAAIGAPLRHESEVVRVALDASGDTLATQTLDGRARLWRRSGAGFVEAPIEGRFTSLAVSGDGACFALGEAGGGAQILCGARRITLSRQEGDIDFIAFSPDGALAVAATGGGRVRFWNIASGVPSGAAFDNGGAIVGLAFSPDGQTLATAGEEGVVRFWSTETSAPVAAPLRLRGRGSGVAFSPDGQFVVAASFGVGNEGGEATLWARNGAEWRRAGRPLRHDGIIMAAAFSGDGGSLLTASVDGVARIWDLGANMPAPISLRHGGRYVVALAFSPDGALLASVGDEGALKLWRTSDWRELPLHMRHDVPIYDVAFAPSGDRVATAGADNVRVWAVDTGELAFAPIHLEAAPATVAFSPDGALLMTGDDGGEVKLWDARTGVLVRRLLDLDQPVMAVAFSPDNAHFATAGWEMPGRVWRLDDATAVGAPLQHNIATTRIAFYPDGALVATSSLDRSAQVWRASDGTRVAPALRHEDGVHWIAFSPDGSRLATASEDRTVRLWDARTGQAAAAPLQFDVIANVAVFSPDGEWLATGTDDGMVRLWNVAGLIRRPTLAALMRETCASRLDDGARRVSAADAAFAPIIAGRENEDVCRPATVLETMRRGLASLARR